ncbi:Aste57867_23140 [Aphanomyces stellatus]|uniref:Aste57867_23140 protein n=1 Tax=Aphanomyces stellatus TaxID=120398 RepID=A0A485LM49_9STRA|nr:hypothetical protein As57867_023069 [Aphanomyces stellatus]VFT99788.1 Aste57867_23140 [Aphanomyces stellatus]
MRNGVEGSLDDALAANEAYVAHLKTVVLSLEESERRLKQKILHLRRAEYHAALQVQVERANGVLRQFGLVAPAKRARQQDAFFKYAVLRQSATGAIENGIVEPEANEDTRRRFVLERVIPAPLLAKNSMPTRAWNATHEIQLKTTFNAWANHGVEPMDADWDAIPVPGTAAEKRRRWVQLKLDLQKMSAGDDTRLKAMGDARSDDQNWGRIARKLSTPRILRFHDECLAIYQRRLNPAITDWDFNAWNHLTEKKLTALVRVHGERWDDIARLIETLSPDELAQRWQNVLLVRPSTESDRRIVLAAYCYSRRWLHVRWDALMYLIGPRHHLQACRRRFDELLSPR